MYSGLSKTRALLGAAAVLLLCAGTVGAQVPTMAGHPDDYSRVDIEYGARLYAEYCERCHGVSGTGVSGVDLRSGNLRRASSNRQLARVITEGFPNLGMPPMELDQAELAGLIAYVRNMNSVDPGSVKPGNPERGRGVFEGKGACLSCHRVNGKGSRKGPELSDIGALRSAGAIERTLLDPNGQMIPINRPVRIVTQDGRVIQGRRLNEDTYTVQLADEEGRLVSVVKEGLREFTISTESPMPSYKGELSAEELADLVAYLLSLKGQ